MTDSPGRVHTEHDFALDSGARLERAQLAYVTMGELNGQRSNAILMAHGGTSSHTFIEPGSAAAEGSWSDLIGPGRAIDTRRFFVISSNALGSCYGSSGPASVDPRTGKRYGPSFPHIGFGDMVRLQKSMLAALQIPRLHAVVGVSMGGFQALQWGVQYSDLVDKLVVVLSALSAKLVAPTGSDGLRKALMADPHWNGGWFDESERMLGFLTALRINTLRTYGMERWLTDQKLDPAECSSRMQSMAEHWARSFDANALVTLWDAMSGFDVTGQVACIRAKVLYVLSTTDALFPVSMAPAILQLLRAHGVDVNFHELKSEYGHLASGLDWQGWAGPLQNFLD